MAGALAMLCGLLAVARVSGGERSAEPSPAEAEERARDLAARAERYCAEMLGDDRIRLERCVHDQVSAAQEIHRIALPMRDDDPRRRILDSCASALGEDMHLRLDCYQEQLGSLQLSPLWTRSGKQAQRTASR
jgi:hypothetical protein